jgi:iron-sulfur cluster repair protein YtfE (RIC family)
MARHLRFYSSTIPRRLRMNIDPHLKVADIYRYYPDTLPVLAKYKIDLCCGGRHPLEEVAEKRGIDLAKLLRDLEEAVKVRS